MIAAQVKRRVSGQAAVDRYIVSKRRLALSAQEVIASFGLLGLGLGMTLDAGGITSPVFHERFDEIGGMELWGVVFLAIAIPQLLTMGLAWLGYIELTLGHNMRVASLIATCGIFLFTAGVWISVGSIWAGGFWCAIYAGAAAAAARHVHLYNGHSDHRIYLPPEINALLSRNQP